MVRSLKRMLDRHRAKTAHRWIVQADRARNRQEWSLAAANYAAALALNPHLAHIHVQHGHARKEAGDWRGAEQSYRFALEEQPDEADTWLQLGHLLKLMGRLVEANAAYQMALILDPGVAAAARELRNVGASELIPASAWHEGLHGGTSLAEMLRETARQIEKMVGVIDVPSKSFAAFRKSHAIAPPPAGSGRSIAPPISIRIGARRSTPAELRVTLTSLVDQSEQAWRAHIVGSTELAEHPVASMAAIDPRISFHEADVETSGNATVLLKAGTSLDHHALEWLLFAYAMTNCTAAYCDHDEADETWRGDRDCHSPALQPLFDSDWFGGGLSSPAIIFLAPGNRHMGGDIDHGRALCRIAAEGGRVVHVPRLLATIVNVSASAAGAPADTGAYAINPKSSALAPVQLETAGNDDQRVSVIIASRDQADLLRQAVETLIDNTAKPAALEIIIVNNRSIETATQDTINRLRGLYGIKIIDFDEAFNWSRANNLGSERSLGELLLFLNNDTEMLTAGWDDLLRTYLRRDDVGLIGARLLYADLTVQHAGILLGLGDGDPVHEGVGAGGSDGGPDGRWLRRRAVAAVTGACMAMRRRTWRDMRGFDEQLPLGYNDVDMCLRVRAAGMRVLYAPDISLIHHESKTRGINITRAQVAWDRSELRSLHLRWGDRLFKDPTYNLHWRRDRPGFQGFREPQSSEILQYIQDQVPHND